jgi:anti-sigma factor RsiW
MQCPTEHDQSIDVLLDYVAGRLEPAKLAVLERHLTSCPRCAEFALDQGQVWRALDIWQAPAVKQDFNQRLLQGMERVTKVPWYRGASGPRSKSKAAMAIYGGLTPDCPRA